MEEETMSYPGGKAGDGVFQTIINQIPPHDTLVIPFLGNCGILRNILPSETTIAIELDSDVLSSFRDDRGQPRPGLILYHGCGIQYLENYHFYGFDSQTVVYCDPPYLQKTRVKKRIYRYEMTEADHIRLLNAISRQADDGTKILISGYESTLYNRLLKGWRCIRFWAATRGKPRVECLWMSFDEPTELHDYRYLGDNKRERERIGRKRRRTVRKMLDLPALERASIMQEILAAEAAAVDPKQ